MADIENTRALGASLRNARKRAGLTQYEASQVIEVARTTISAIEQGIRHLRACELAALAEAYHTDPATLLQSATNTTIDESVAMILKGLSDQQKSVLYRLLHTEPCISTSQAVKVLSISMSPAAIEDVACALLHALIESEVSSEAG